MQNLAITLASIFSLGLLGMGCGDVKEKINETFDVDPDLVGTWESTCEPVGSIELLPNATRSFEFGATGNFTRTERFYNDDDDKCDTKEVALVYEIEGNYETKGESKDNKDLELINYSAEHIYVIVKSESAIDALDTLELCGIENWKDQLNKKVEITDKNCAGFNIKKGDVVVDVYDVNEKKMFTGTALTFSLRDDSDDRPTDVDRDLVYIKQ